MNLKIKLIISAVVLLLIGTLITTTIIMKNKIDRLDREYATAMTNLKAYELENAKLKDDTIEFQYTIDQLYNSQDSLVNRIVELKKHLKIKDKNISRLEYLVSENKKRDSIVFIHDTIFRKHVNIDTTLRDNWSSIYLKLEYPNTVITDVSFKNEVLVATYLKKETIKPPHKCAFIRLFQKKHKVIHVDVQEQNPYCEIKEQKFINIVK